MISGTKWKFAPKGSRFEVRLRIERERGYQYDGEDSDGAVQNKIDSGEWVAFGSICEVLLDGVVIGTDSLWGSVYADGEENQFWTAHRDTDPRNRNCSLYTGRTICHYFPGMVRQAVEMARDHVRDMPVPPRIRESAP